MNKVIAVALVSISLALPVVSHAQFGGLGKMLGGNKESPSAGTDLVGQQDKLTGNYINRTEKRRRLRKTQWR